MSRVNPLGRDLAEVLQGDAVHGANLRDGASGESCQLDSGGGISDLRHQRGTGHAGADLSGDGWQALFRLQQQRQGAQQRRCVGIGQGGPQQKLWIGPHLGLQQQRRQLTPWVRGQKHPIRPVFTRFKDGGHEPIAAIIWSRGSGQIRQQLQDAIGLALEQAVEELVASLITMAGGLWASCSGPLDQQRTGGADQFLVSQGGSRLKQGATLDEVLVPIEPRLRLVSGKS